MNEVKNIREVKTGMNSEVAYDVIASVIGQLSDGMWENCRAAEKFWKFVDVRRDDDGSVVIEVSKESGKSQTLGSGRYAKFQWTENGFRWMDDKQVREYFAKKIKAVVSREKKDNPEAGIKWNAAGDVELQYLGGHVKHEDGTYSVVTDGFACAVAKMLAA